MPELHVVACPNGAGKTTCFKQLVPEDIDYINADLIAKTIREQAGSTPLLAPSCPNFVAWKAKFALTL